MEKKTKTTSCKVALTRFLVSHKDYIGRQLCYEIKASKSFQFGQALRPLPLNAYITLYFYAVLSLSCTFFYFIQLAKFVRIVNRLLKSALNHNVVNFILQLTAVTCSCAYV